MKSFKGKVLSLVLSAVIVLTAVGTPVFAAEYTDDFSADMTEDAETFVIESTETDAEVSETDAEVFEADVEAPETDAEVLETAVEALETDVDESETADDPLTDLEVYSESAENAEDADAEEISLAAPTISSVTNVSSGVKVAYSKVTGAEGYYIYRSTSANGSYSKVGEVTSASTASYTDADTDADGSITSGKNYYYKVSAYCISDDDAVTESEQSSCAGLLYLKRAAISGFIETANGIKIKYSKVAGAKGYYIYRSTSKNGTYKKVTTVESGSTLSYTDTGAGTSSDTNGKTYYYKIQAYAGDSVSAESAVKSVRYLKAETISSISKTSSGYAKLTWKKNSKASGYYIYRKVSGGEYKKVKTIKSSDTTSWKDKNISKNKKYTYYVKAYYGSSVSTKANTLSIMVPSKTSISSLTSKTASFTVKWKKNSSVTGYQIQYATNSKFTSGKKTVTVKKASTVSKTVTGLKSAKKYYVRVRSYKTVGGKKFYSDWSKVKTVTTKKKVTVFVGDLISVGLYPSSYNGISKIGISGTKQVVAAGSLNTVTYRTSSQFGGLTGVQKVATYNPTRVYVMLGMNEVTWKSEEDVKDGYTKLIKSIKKSCPNADIVILALSPVTKSKAASVTKFKRVSTYNKWVKEAAEDNGCYYYDYTSAFKTSEGYLKTDYCGGDGIHWSAKAYAKFGELITAYDATLP